jgi:hypothetical protein
LLRPRCARRIAYSGGKAPEVACWAHARRYFVNAQDTDAKRGAQLLALVTTLYTIERRAKDLDEDARRTLRQQESVPILARIKEWLGAEVELVLPRSQIAEAIQHVRNQWEALTVYTTQGFLAIDNNAAERALKPVAIGRKNWLFPGADRAATAAATLWTLIGSAQRHGIDPRYLTSVLAKIASTPLSKLDQFLPDTWAREDAAEPPLPTRLPVP